MHRKVRSVLAAMCIIGSAPMSASADPLTTAFTYQGQLKKAGVPVTGTVGGVFRLYDADTGGTEVGSIGPAVGEVVNGLFTVELDFGAAAFNGEARWLEIELEFPAGGGNWVMLSPRQRLTPTPYASTAISTVGVDGHSLDAADGSPIDVVRVDDYGRVRMEVGGLTVFDNLAQGVSFNSDDFYFAEGLSEDPVYVYSSDTDRHEFWTDGSRRMVIDAGGRVGIGTNAPEAGLHLEGPGFPAAFLVLNSTGGNNDTGMRLERDGDVKWHVFNASPGDDLSFRNTAYTPVVTASQSGNVGVGTPYPTTTLHVNGDIYWDNGHLTGLAVSDVYLVESANAGDQSVEMVSSDNSLCFLTHVWFRDLETGSENSHCVIEDDGTHWVLHANAYGGDPFAHCEARCLQW